MKPVRPAFLDASAVSRSVLAREEVRRCWDRPSALAEMSVRGLAGHLVRATGAVLRYLDRPEPAEAPIGPAEYYVRALETSDLTSQTHVDVRQRGEEEAAMGYDALLARLEKAHQRLEERLEIEPEQRLVRVFKDLVLTLDDYLVTRIVEIVVHTDDLTASVGVETARFHAGTVHVAIDNLVDVASFRHGDMAVLRALSRRERDEVDALRVF
jgi:Mycothiol maleylpyruvate isomerase N-terminal domain